MLDLNLDTSIQTSWPLNPSSFLLQYFVIECFLIHSSLRAREPRLRASLGANRGRRLSNIWHADDCIDSLRSLEHGVWHHRDGPASALHVQMMSCLGGAIQRCFEQHTPASEDTAAAKWWHHSRMAPARSAAWDHKGTQFSKIKLSELLVTCRVSP